MQLQAPTAFSYWVKPDQLLAGEHPGSRYEVRKRQTLRQLLQAQVTIFIDLTESLEYYS